MFDFARYLFLALGFLGAMLLANGSWVGWLFLAGAVLIIIWLAWPNIEAWLKNWHP